VKLSPRLRYDGSIVASIPVQTAGGNYSVYVQPGLLANIAQHLQKTGLAHGKIFVVTTPEIWKLWSKKFLFSFARGTATPEILFLPSGERYKRLASVEKLADAMVERSARRDSLLVAFGGGVAGDLTGFLAAIYMRGIPYVQVPTTYLAQIDSSVGGKTGVNLRTGKNLIGSFHQPSVVLTDPEILKTLPPRELRAGLVESIKAAVLGDGAYFQWLEKNCSALLRGDLQARTQAIRVSVRIKARIVSADERESGQRMLLNLGHTVGHAIEAATQYRKLLHGEAIAWGMIAAGRLAAARGAWQAADAARVERLLFRLGPLPKFSATPQRLLQLAGADKKNRSRTRNFVLPVRIGKAIVVTDVSDAEMLSAIRSMIQTVQELGV
jgi:3-dehydroquinate synthase